MIKDLIVFWGGVILFFMALLDIMNNGWNSIIANLFFAIICVIIIRMMLPVFAKRGKRRKRQPTPMIAHLIAMTVCLAGVLGIYRSIKPVKEEYAWKEYRQIVIQDNISRGLSATGFLFVAFWFIAKPVVAKMYGSELMSLMKSEDIDSEANLMHEFIIDKMQLEEKKELIAGVKLDNLLRLTHSLGYRVTIRKVSDTSIEHKK